VAQRLGDLLLWAGLITEEQLDKALAEQKKAGGRLGSVIARLGYLNETDIAQFLGKQLGVKAVNLADITIEETLLKLLPANLAQKNFAIPVSKRGRILTVVMLNPADIQALEDIRFSTGYEIAPAVAPESAILKAIDRYYGSVGMLAKVTEDLESVETMTVTEEQAEEDVIKRYRTRIAGIVVDLRTRRDEGGAVEEHRRIEFVRIGGVERVGVHPRGAVHRVILSAHAPRERVV
jgi:type IV pilus assembly protein PilB